ncbi:hypothetical protein [Spiroplasma turonicum]|uniref:Uncharacterized protein n=1 Tax=Spiroplasma turonicum TaxID=216946 RepID=A0A0K1P7B5_9MOLU|nr:hypothetical protein [Spiroplasma turonicum]AKU80190.1 hypothetical protein STURON_00944 [Spiroplasma turonicum]ALX71190.1 hypothetical protein STURO_v1c09390 [Spiroplasma turonicum]
MLRDYDYYSFLPYNIINKEIIVLFSMFGQDNKYLKQVEYEWFGKKDLDSFREFIENSFDKTEVDKDKIVNRDSLSCLLRLMSMCDCFFDYQNMYDITRTLFIETNKQKIDNLEVYDYAFKEFAFSFLKDFDDEFNKLMVSPKYILVIKEIGDSLEKIKNNERFSCLIQEFYKLNDLISDLLDILELTEDDKSEFETKEEVVLYNFAIYYSTKFYFSLLFRELIIQQEEKLTNTIIMIEKPLVIEDELRFKESKLVSDLPEDLFYRALKN